jgi:protein-disulfide isomerase
VCAALAAASEPAPGMLVGIPATAPARGDARAKVTIVEFSDYQCLPCANFAHDTLPAIRKEYIDAGKLRHVFRNLPLETVHPLAFKAHQAALCAGDQGRYWEMHDRLFEQQRALQPEQLIAHAKGVGLAERGLRKCLASGRHVARIRADMDEARQLGVEGTPAFLIGVSLPDGRVKTVRYLRGARPYDEFKAAIEASLAAH